MPTPEIVTGVLIKLAGAFAGSILALVFIPPKTRREFWRRGSGSLIMGMVFAPTALDWLKLTANIEGMIAAACAAASLSPYHSPRHLASFPVDSNG